MYKLLPEHIVYEEIISVRNNYAVFERKNGFTAKAIDICQETLTLVEKFYTSFDERLYYTLLNLDCFYYEDNQHIQGDLLTKRISEFCPPTLS